MSPPGRHSKRRRRVLAALPLVLAAWGPGCGGSSDQAEAVAILEVRPPEASTAGTEGPADPVAIARQALRSTARRLESEPVLGAAAARLGERTGAPARYRGPEGAAHLAADLAVRPIPQTRLLEVELSGPDRLAAGIVLREIVSAFVEVETKQRSEQTRERIEQIEAERDHVAERSLALKQRLDRFVEDTGVIPGPGADTEYDARLDALARRAAEQQTLVAQARADWQRFEELRAEAERSNDLRPVVTAYPLIRDLARRDPGVIRLAQQVSSLEAELGGRVAVAERREKEKALAEAKDRLARRQGEALARGVRQLEAQLTQRLEVTRQVAAEVQDLLAQARIEASRLSRRMEEYRDLQDEYDQVRARLRELEARIDETRIHAVLEQPSVRVVQWPALPAE